VGPAAEDCSQAGLVGARRASIEATFPPTSRPFFSAYQTGSRRAIAMEGPWNRRVARQAIMVSLLPNRSRGASSTQVFNATVERTSDMFLATALTNERTILVRSLPGFHPVALRTSTSRSSRDPNRSFSTSRS